MRSIVTAIALSLMSISVLGGDAPRTPLAANAIKRHEVEAEKARQAYFRTLIELDKKLISDLESALKQVMQAGNLEEAKRVEAALLSAKDQMEQHTAELTGTIRASDIVGIKWEWPDPKFGARSWFILNADGTVVAGWHEDVGHWKITGRRSVTAKIAKAEGNISIIEFSLDLNSATLRPANARKGDPIARFEE